MTPLELVAIAVALAVGFALAWVLASARAREATRAEYESRLADAETRRAAEARSAEELRAQLAQAREQAEAVRQRFEEEQKARVAAETSLREAQKYIEEQRAAFEDVRARMTETFKALAADALTDSQRQFLALAQSNFEKLQTSVAGDLGKRQEAIRGLVEPLAANLKSLDEKLAQIEILRQQAYGHITEQVRKLTEVSEDLRKETGSLVTSLRQPQIKGKWGELLLRRALELTGMSPHCSFVEQPTTETEDGRLRPDLIVHIPGGGMIVIDSKVPQEAFLKALAAKTQDDYWAAMKDHARLVREHVSKLASRKYWEQFPRSPEFVVLFLPAESFFSAALEQDRTLIEDAMDKRVILASPTTLLALLRTVAHGWRQEQLAENAAKISAEGKLLYERVVTFIKHFEDMRAGLERANRAFNSAVGSYTERLRPQGEKFLQLGVQSTAELPEIEPTETALRPFSATREENS